MSLLADRLLYKKNWYYGSYNAHGNRDAVKGFDYLISRISQKIYYSRVLTLKADAARLAYDISLQLTPSEVVNMLGYFRLPSERMWIEFDRDDFFPNPNANKGRVGYLLERDGDTGFTIHMVEEWEENEAKPIIAPILSKIRFNSEWEEIPEANHFGFSLRQKIRFGMGYDYEPEPDGLDIPFRYMAQHYQFEYALDEDLRVQIHGIDKKNIKAINEDLRNAYVQQISEVAGTVRHILAILLLYHFPPTEHYERKPTKPGERRIIDGKSKPYLSFEEMNIRLPKRKPTNTLNWVRRGLPKLEVKKRAHEVDGHWRRVRPLTAIELAALGKPEDALTDRERFKYCWVREHQRGDASIGYVRKRKNLVV